MTGSNSPLMEIFYRLQRGSLPLGVTEYLAALRALAAGFGTGSRDELLWMCQALWAKSAEEQQQVAEALDAALPRRLSAADLEALSREAAARPSSAPAGPRPSAATPPTSEAAAGPAGKAAAGPEFVGLGALPPETSGAPTLTRPASVGTWPTGRHFDLVGELPVPRRHMKRAWRYFRRMQRSGPPTELDVEATAARLGHDGVLTAPVLVPRRRNQAMVALLIDEGGSMVPFRRLTGALLESARQGGFARADVFFFHDVPGETVYREPTLRDPVPREEALRPFAGSGVLIVGDCGAARRGHDPARVERTRQAVAAVRAITPRVAWLNPVPGRYWLKTTAAAVRLAAGVPMFPLDRPGLDAAMDVLRGRANP